MTEVETDPGSTTTMTFLFTDLEGSTRLWQQFPTAMQSALARHDELVRTAVEAAHGHVVKTTGDGFLAVFSSVEDSVRACIGVQRALLEEPWGETGALRVRMALHIGEAQQRGGDYFGTSINRTARLMAAASGGQVLMSADAAAMVADHLPDKASLRDLGEHRLKDLLRPEHIFQLVHPALADDFPAIASLNRTPNNLPSQPTVFVGRQTELADIKNLLGEDNVRLLTLVGPGGTGKTRLALQSGADLSDRFADGTYFVDLAPVRDPGAVPAAIARTMGLNESSNGSMLDVLKSQLRDRNLLLLLDNFEQVTPAAVQIADLLQHCRQLKLLVTSREALHVRAERLYPVPPLGLPTSDVRQPDLRDLANSEAVQLFVERAQEVKPGFELTAENAPAVAELCRRLDGLPLAIELAAARIRLFSPQGLVERLSDRFKLLQGGARDLPERQQTLRDTIEWSYELLAVPEKTLYAVLSVFSGCTFDAVEAVVGDVSALSGREMDTVEVLASLVDKSLIRFLDEGAGEPRLRMLETIREHAAELLSADPELHDEASRAHATHFAAFAQREWQRMAGHEREAAMQEMAADVDNLRIAWRYWADRADLEQLHRMTDGLWLLYDGRGWYQATIELTTDLLDVLSTSPAGPEQARQEILLQTSLARALMAIKGYTPEIEAAYKRALALSEEHGEIPQMFPVLRGLSSYYMYRAEFDKGAQIGRHILELAERGDDDWLRVHGYLVLGANTGFVDSYAAGLEILDKGIALFEEEPQGLRPYQLGSYPGIVCYTTSAFFWWWSGFPDRARNCAERALELARKLDHPFTLAYALFHTGAFHLWRGEMDLAEERARTMLDIGEEYEFQFWVPLSSILLGTVLTAKGQHEEGLSRIEDGFQRYKGLISPPVFFPLITGMRAMSFARAGRPNEGLEMIDRLLKEIDELFLVRDNPQLLLLKGDLLLAVSPENEAEAAQVFRPLMSEQGRADAKLVALQAATRLCRLEMRNGPAQASGRALAELYASFTEGFETHDLVEARSVLEEWRRQ